MTHYTELPITGYRRDNGRVGIRNHVLIVSVDDISNAAVTGVASLVRGTLALPHPYGRLQFGDDLDLTFNTLIGYGKTPNVAAVIVPTVMTLAILILSEIIPKTLGANYWRALVGFTTRSVNLIIIVLYPLVGLSQVITRTLKSDKERSVLSRSEFSAMAESIAEQGVLQKQEFNIIQSLLRFNSVRAQDVMTPRTVMIAADENQTIAEFNAERPSLRFSRIPLYDENIDHVTGFVLRTDLLDKLVAGNENSPLKDLKRPIVMVDENDLLPSIFNTLIEKKAHIALVVSQFGGSSGVLTMEDVVETLLGMEIIDESDNTTDMQQLARKNWEARARALGLIPTDPNE